MTGLALALVLTSALMHATWNFFAKRADGGLPFAWMFSALGTVLFLPVIIVILIVQQPTLGLREWGGIAVTCAIHVGYYLLLERGYRVGDLSFVYPIGRGTGPILSTLGAIVLLGERPTVLVWVGTLLVTAGVLIITGNPFRARSSTPALIYGLLIGLSMAVYTLWDKQVVGVLLIPPLFLIWCSGLTRTVVLYPQARRDWGRVQTLWRDHRREAFGVALLDPMSYTLFLMALAVTNVSLVAPVRQISIVIGTFLGAKVLAESGSQRRLLAAAVMVIGVVTLALPQ
jgi:drug/metabolite transporter (DMT)-like permease